jgi:hypothetical protein
VAYEPNLKCNENVYYFKNSYLYCNIYRWFTKDHIKIHNKTPPKSSNKAKLAVNFNFDTKKIFWEINNEKFEELDFYTNEKPCYIVVGMFEGSAKFTYL